jgi:hypothetical protein
MTTFPYGYAGSPQGMGTMLTWDQMMTKSTVYNLHPEVRRRFKALIEFAATKGVHLGVGTGWRVQPSPPPPGFAQPGNSWHESCPVNPVSPTALAIDTVCDVSWNWMEQNCAAYGFRTFRNVNNEPWHIQPTEIPAGRSYATVLPPIKTWDLPGDTTPPTPIPETEEDVVWRVAKRENGAFFIGDGKTSYWVKDGEGDVDSSEALVRMAPGAINTVRSSWDKATDTNAGPKMVTAWNQIKTTMKDNNLKKYVGANKLLG